jgi:AI-2 transport system substrate-binding protein
MAALLMMLWGCGDDQPSAPAAGEPKPVSNSNTAVWLVPKSSGISFFDSANAGAQAYAAKHGINVQYAGSPIPEIEKQIEIIDQAIANKVKAIVISSLDSTALDDALKRAAQNGITVVTWNSDVSPDARKVMVSQGTPAQLGSRLVEMATKSLIKRGLKPATDPIEYVWHFSRSTVTDQNSWRQAGEAYIESNYPNWVNVKPDNYYSNNDPDLAVKVGHTIFQEHPDINVILCNDAISLPGQAQAAKELNKTARDVTITGFSTPNSMREYALAGIVDRWALWDCRIQASIACYLAWYLAKDSKELVLGQMIDIPDIGLVEVMSNNVLQPNSPLPHGLGVVLLPNRIEFTSENVNDYDF